MRCGTGGPCCHCFRTTSPCWRKGPADKPVLCNACGARWLVKRNLDGYYPGQKSQCFESSKTPVSSAPTKKRKHSSAAFSDDGQVLTIRGDFTTKTQLYIEGHRATGFGALRRSDSNSSTATDYEKDCVKDKYCTTMASGLRALHPQNGEAKVEAMEVDNSYSQTAVSALTLLGCSPLDMKPSPLLRKHSGPFTRRPRKQAHPTGSAAF